MQSEEIRGYGVGRGLSKTGRSEVEWSGANIGCAMAYQSVRMKAKVGLGYYCPMKKYQI